MTESNLKIENEPVPKDISKEFLSMGSQEFMNFLHTQDNEPALSIIIDWKDVPTARRLKAFVEKEGRTATIRATKEQFDQEWNVFSSGVKWEKV